MRNFRSLSLSLDLPKYLSLLISPNISWFGNEHRQLTAQSYNEEAYADMMEFLETHSLNDGDKFCADLMRQSSAHKTLALRILEVSVFCILKQQEEVN